MTWNAAWELLHVLPLWLLALTAVVAGVITWVFCAYRRTKRDLHNTLRDGRL